MEASRRRFSFVRREFSPLDCRRERRGDPFNRLLGRFEVDVHDVDVVAVRSKSMGDSDTHRSRADHGHRRRVRGLSLRHEFSVGSRATRAETGLLSGA